MRLLTNFERFPEQWESRNGLKGEAQYVTDAWTCLGASSQADFVIINCDARMTIELSMLYLLAPWLRRPVLSHDITLRPPQSWMQKLQQPVKRYLLARVDHFTHHFQDLTGYQRWFGIGPERSSMVPFKPNLRHRLTYRSDLEGEYILCCGFSERNYDLFLAVMDLLPYPGRIPPPRWDLLRLHGSRFTRPLSQLPPNVRIFEEDTGTSESLRDMLQNARLVLLPTVPGCMKASGIGIALNAMLMGKCVITNPGTMVNGVFSDELLVAPSSEPADLAALVRRAWEDDEFRQRTAQRGKAYAESCGGEAELRQRVLDCAIEQLFKTRRPGRHPSAN